MRFAVFIDLVARKIAVHRCHVVGGQLLLSGELFGPTNPDVSTTTAKFLTQLQPFLALLAILAVGLNVSDIMLSCSNIRNAWIFEHIR